MKAALLHGPRDLRVEQLPMPDAPGPGEVLLHIRSMGICGSDVHAFADFAMGGEPFPAPQTIGHECAAEVVEVGPGVERPMTGDRVGIEPSRSCGLCEWCRGGMPNVCPEVQFLGFPGTPGVSCEFTVLPAELCYPIPEQITFDEAVLLEPLQISLHAVRLVPVVPGEHVVIIGCGPVGLGCLQLVKAAGATKIIATDKLDYRLDVARRLGADFTVNVTRENAVERVREITAGRGAHKVFECTNTAGGPPQAAEVAAIGARIAMIGIPEGDDATVPTHVARRKQLSFQFIRRSPRLARQAVELVSSGLVDLKTCVTHSFGLDDIAKGFELVGNYADGVIKAVINP